MHYKKALSSLAIASLLISSSCLAAGSNPLYSCKDVTALSKQDDQSKSNFVFHTMPNYVEMILKLSLLGLINIILNQGVY